MSNFFGNHNLIFETYHLLKLYPIFDQLCISEIQSTRIMLIFGQKSCFLGPTIKEIP